MTREERSFVIEMLKHPQSGDLSDIREAVYLVIQDLEQKPCTDAISKQAVKEQMLKYGFTAPDMTVTEFIEDCLLTVRPKQKMGRWILSGGYWRCSECKEKALLTFDKSEGGCREYEPVRSKYCPNCGKRMEESE